MISIFFVSNYVKQVTKEKKKLSTIYIVLSDSHEHFNLTKIFEKIQWLNL